MARCAVSRGSEAVDAQEKDGGARGSARETKGCCGRVSGEGIAGRAEGGGTGRVQPLESAIETWAVPAVTD